MIVIFWKPGQLCRARVPELQKTPDQHRRRAVSAAIMVKELCPHVLDGREWVYHGSPVMEFPQYST